MESRPKRCVGFLFDTLKCRTKPLLVGGETPGEQHLPQEPCDPGGIG
jgi:hypothetical protein